MLRVERYARGHPGLVRLCAALAVILVVAAVAAAGDRDGDGVEDVVDNCPDVANADQTDRGGLGGPGGDGQGDACTCGDVNGDGSVRPSDVTVLRRAFAGLDPGLARPELCNASGPADLADADENGLPDDCGIADVTAIRRALLGLDPGLGRSCGRGIPPNGDALPPVVELAAPARVEAGTSFRVSARASDDVGVVRVRFVVDDVEVSQSSSEPYVLDYTSNAAPGARVVVRAIAEDGAGRSGATSRSIEVVAGADDSPPVIESLSLPGEAAPGESVAMRAVVTDDRGVSEVRFLRASTTFGVDAEAPYRAVFEVPAAASEGDVLELRVEAFDGAGNSAFVTASLMVVALADTTPPALALGAPETARAGQLVRVVAETQDAGGLEAVTFRVAGSPLLEDDASPFEVTYRIPESLAPGATLAWTATASDFAGNATDAAASTTIVAGGVGALLGAVFDDARSQPIPNASAIVDAAGGDALDPALELTSDRRGRYFASLPEGPARIRVSAPGFTTVVREVEIPSGGVGVALDARLSALAPPLALDALAGGTIASATGSGRLRVEGGALADGVAPRLTRLDEQALPRPLPKGFAPLRAFHVELGSGVVHAPVTFSFVDAPPGTPVAARFDPSADVWLRAAATSNGADVDVSLGAGGTLVLVRPDTAGPLPEVGAPLGSTNASGLPADATAAVEPLPDVLFFSSDARSRVEIPLESSPAASSGTRLSVRIGDLYRRSDGSALLPPVQHQDLLAFRRSTGARARFTLAPARDFPAALLLEGRVSIEVEAPLGTPELLDETGGSFANEHGTLVVPPGAVAGHAALRLLAPGDEALVLLDDPRFADPAGPSASVSFLGGVDVELVPHELLAPAELRVPALAAPPAGHALVVARVVELRGVSRLEWVAFARHEDDALVSVPPSLELPLPGVRGPGRYLFLAIDATLAFATGEVSTTEGGLVRTLIESDALPLVSLADAADPSFAIPLPSAVAGDAGDATLFASDVETGAATAVAFDAAAPGERRVVDLVLDVPRLRVLGTSPPEAALRVPIGVTPSLRLSSDVDPATLEPDRLVLLDANGPVPASTYALADGRTLVVVPDRPLVGETKYTVQLGADVADVFGNALLGNQPDGAFATSFTTDDVTPPEPPGPGSLAFEQTGAGIVRVVGGPGALEPDVVVGLSNPTTGSVVSTATGADGSFTVSASAGLLDALELVVRDAAGNETRQPLGRVDPLPGRGVVGPEGGFFEGEAGSGVTVPPGVLAADAVLSFLALDPNELPDLPFPPEEGVEVLAAASLGIGDTEIPDVIELRLVVDGHPELTIIDRTPPLFEVVRGLRLPDDLVPGSVLVVRARALDRFGQTSEARAEVRVVDPAGTGPEPGVQALLVEGIPSVALSVPAEVVPGGALAVDARGEPPDIKVRFPAPPDLTGAEQFLIWEVVDFGDQQLFSLVTTADVVQVDGEAFVESNTPPFRGPRRNIARLVATVQVSALRSFAAVVSNVSSRPSLVGLSTALGDALEAQESTLLGIELIQQFSRPRRADIAAAEFAVIPLPAGVPGRVALVDLDTNTLLFSAEVPALAPGAIGEVVVFGEDGNPPVVTGTTSFANGEVPPDAPVLLNFSHLLDTTTVTPETLFIEDEDGNRVPARIEFPKGSREDGAPASLVEIQPLTLLDESRRYTVVATTEIRRVGAVGVGEGSRTLAREFRLRFRTREAADLIGALSLPNAVAFDVLGDEVYVVTDGTDNRLYEIDTSDPRAPVISTSVFFHAPTEGSLRDVRVVQHHRISADPNAAPIPDVLALSLGDESVFSTLQLIRLDDPDLIPRNSTLVSTPIRVLQQTAEVAVIPIIASDGTTKDIEVIDASQGLLEGVPKLAATPWVIDHNESGVLYFINQGLGLMSLDVPVALADLGVGQRGAELGPTFPPRAKTGIRIVVPRPAAALANEAIQILEPAGQAFAATVGFFRVRGVVHSDAVERIVVSTIRAEIARDAQGRPVSFEVDVPLYPDINGIVVDAFDADGARLAQPIELLAVVPGRNPLLGGTNVGFDAPGLSIRPAGPFEVTARVLDTVRFDQIFVNGTSVSAKRCDFFVEQRTNSCGWSGEGTAAFTLEPGVNTFVATAIDNDPDFVEFIGVPYSDMDVQEGLIAAANATRDRVQIFDASGLVPMAELEVENPFRVAFAPRVQVDLDDDGVFGQAENEDGDGFTSLDELRTLVLVGGGRTGRLTFLDVTSPGDPFELGHVDVGSSVRRAFAVPEQRIAFVAADTAVLQIDLSRAGFSGLLDEDGDGRDDRILARIPVLSGGAVDVIPDLERQLLYVLQQDRGISILRLPCDRDVGVDATRRSTPRNVPFNTVARMRQDLQFAIARGLRRDECGEFVLEGPGKNAALLSQGSSACIWREDERCSSAFQPSVSDHDFEFFVDPLDLGRALECAVQIEFSIKNLDAAGEPLPEPLPNRSFFDDASVFAERFPELAEAFTAAAPNSETGLCGAGSDPFGDLCLGRNGLLLKWALEGEFVHTNPEPGRAFDPARVFDGDTDLDEVVQTLASPITGETRLPRNPAQTILGSGTSYVEPSHIPRFEGREWLCSQQFAIEKSGARFRVRGAGIGPADVQWPFFIDEVHKIGKAGIRSVYGRLIADPVGNRMLVGATRRDYNSPSGCLTDFDFATQPDGTVARPASTADFGWKRCETFEEYVASVAIQGATRGLGILSEADAMLAFESFRIKSDVGPPIASELEANTLMVRVLDFIERMRQDPVVLAAHETVSAYFDQDRRRQNLDACTDQAIPAFRPGGESFAFKAPLRVFNGAHVAIPSVPYALYHDGDEVQRQIVSLRAGQDLFVSRKKLAVEPEPAGLHDVAFVIDPENETVEFDKRNNFDGIVYYYLDPTLPLGPDPSALAAAAAPPGARIRPERPVTIPSDASEVCFDLAGGPIPAEPSAPSLDVVVTAIEVDPAIQSPAPVGTSAESSAPGATIELAVFVRNTGNEALHNIVIETSLGAVVTIESVPAGVEVVETIRVTMPEEPTLVLIQVSAEDLDRNDIGVVSAAVDLEPRARELPFAEPVILIPGMAGSVLVHAELGELWPAPTVFASNEDKRALDVRLDGPVEATDWLGKVLIKPVYDLLGDAFDAQTDVAGPVYRRYPHQPSSARTISGCVLGDPSAPANLFIFPWDWRLGVGPAAEKLDDYVGCIRRIHGRRARIHVVAHSMGGLVARRYALDHPGELSKVITVGSPWLGAPKAIHTLETGQFVDAGQWLLVSTDLLSELASHMPGLHELLPTRRYFDQVSARPPPIGTSPYELKASRDTADGLRLPLTPQGSVELDYAAFGNQMNHVLQPTSAPARRNERLHDADPRDPTLDMDDWSRDASTSTWYHAFGSGVSTTVRVVDGIVGLPFDPQSPTGNPVGIGVNPNVGPGLGRLPTGIADLLRATRDLEARKSPAGDGTVPLDSARRISPAANLNERRAELLELAARDHGDVEHNEVLGNPLLHNWLFSILEPWRVQRDSRVRDAVCNAGDCP